MDDRQIQNHILPGKWRPAGYAALVERHGLQAPLRRVTAVSTGAIKNNVREDGSITVYSDRYWPKEGTDVDHLEFAVARENLDLLLLKKAFAVVDPKELAERIESNPQTLALRRLWFLYEWMTEQELPLGDIKFGNYADMLDADQYYAINGEQRLSRRHRIRNNLPGTREFCAIARRGKGPDAASSMAARAHSIVDAADRGTVNRAAAYLLLADSRSTFAIEGEHPARDRLARWGRTLGLAGKRELSVDFLTELQRQLIENDRFVETGLRKNGVFLGTRDSYGDPRPEFIGARPEDVSSLVNGMIEFDNLLKQDSGFNPMAHAAGLAFGFVYAHPFDDGNGRLHRFLMSHVLGERKFSPEGVVLPVSTAILDRIQDYTALLQSRSGPLMPFIPWKVTPQGNVEVTADTADLYRYLDVTDETQFFSEVVESTVSDKLPRELRYIEAHDRAERRIAGVVEMPSNMVSAIIVQIVQNDGNLSKKRRKRDYAKLTDDEASLIENLVREEFGIEPRLPAADFEMPPSEPRC
jgi:Fic/DOC family